MVSISQELSQCQNAQQLNDFVATHNLRVEIGSMGGRRVVDHQCADSLSIKDLAKQLDIVCKHDGIKKNGQEVSNFVTKVNQLDNEANQELKRQVGLTKIIHAIKSFFAGFDRASFHRETKPEEMKQTQAELKDWIKKLNPEKIKDLNKFFPNMLETLNKLSNTDNPVKALKLRDEVAEEFFKAATYTAVKNLFAVLDNIDGATPNDLANINDFGTIGPDLNELFTEILGVNRIDSDSEDDIKAFDRPL